MSANTWFRPGHYVIATAAALALTTATSQALNLLTDPGFESGTPLSSAMGGWATVVDSAFSQTYDHSGLWSMDCYYDSADSHGVSVQGVAATPGTQYTLTGWGYTPNTLGSGSSGFLILFFSDANGRLLGAYNMSDIQISSTSPANTWIQMSETHTAPAGTAFVYAETTIWDPAPGDAVYFDDLNLTAVPEPSRLPLLGLGLLPLLRKFRG
jgi:hypothetical protein